MVLTLGLTACGADPTVQTTPAPATTAPTPVQPATLGLSPTLATTLANSTTSSARVTSASTTPVSTPAPATNVSNNTGSNNEDWPTYHRDNLRTGYLPNAPDPQKLTPKWKVKLDGAVYAQPLVIGPQLILATKANSLYSLEAQTGMEQWHLNLYTVPDKGGHYSLLVPIELKIVTVAAASLNLSLVGTIIPV